MAAVRLQNLSKTFGATTAVRDLSVHIADGEFFSILGPSGCGKTTTLRMIAGFEMPDSGAIHFDELEVTTLPPNRRNTGMVFQNYALFPHMSVSENVAFGLRAHKMPGELMRARVRETLALLEMGEYLDQPVTQLSGGQQQRVALARALAVQPAILLLDEPLSNLDARLRRSTRHELKRLQRRLGITTIYVTHDQEEALALSDRILIMNDGEAQQIGAPEDIYGSPANLFVMDFIGFSNILRGQIFEITPQRIGVAGKGWKLYSENRIPNTHNVVQDEQRKVGASASVAFRPQDATLLREPGEENFIAARLRFMEFGGSLWEVGMAIGEATCLVHLSSATAESLSLRNAAADDTFWLHVPANKIRIFLCNL
jgi:iron(III) transport system ATP-binding protein